MNNKPKIIKNERKRNVATDKLLSRQNYLVVQANDLARAFGHLTAMQHRLLDFCFSFVKKDSEPNEEYEVDILDILKHFGLNASGNNYMRIGEAFEALNEKTALYLRMQKKNGELGIRMTQLFSHVDIWESGKVKFKFSEEAAPYIYKLRTNFYSFHLNELQSVRSKYSMILLKLWEANRVGNADMTIIKGSLLEWQTWFLAKRKESELWPPYRFKRDALAIAIKEVSDKFNSEMELTTHKKGRKVVGYELVIRAQKPLKKPNFS